MNTQVSTARRDETIAAATSALAVAATAFAGFLAATHLNLVAALAALAVLAAYGAFAVARPRTAIAASFVALLVAGTKFRTRDADESLAGVLDAQILLELGLFGAIAAGIAAMWLAGKVDRRRASAMEVIAGAYVAIALLSTAWSSAPALTFVRAGQLAIVVALAITATRVLTPSEATQRAFAVIGGFAVVCGALAAIFPFASGTFDYPEHGRLRFAWFAVHPIEVGTLAALGALGALSAILFRSEPRMPRPLGMPLTLAAAALVLVLAATGSRGPLFAFLAGTATLVLMRGEPRLRAAVSLIGVAALLGIVAAGPALADTLSVFANSDSVVGRTIFRGQTADEVLGLNGRLDLWDDLRPAIAERSLFGYGYQASRPILLETAHWAAYAHNALLQALLDLGLVGTLTLVALIGLGLFGAFTASTEWLRATIAGVMVFLVLNAVSTESVAGAPGLELLLLMLCGLSAARRAPERANGGWR